ncbi:hypothetical protein LNL84_09230 [Vibrio sp. ZSDZ34]|uniref:Tetratricopeptide repeat protein n=1 Tax=Vibrio gelatinilyticus TaxID=2893468 RepID=A0A9X1WCR0_9VIBR|nr:hypothetical protein [Vibrio gelatinilyticus]MCJ2377015.1 hypothetical protein [Vibrio gelatinilyticus]
MTLTNWLRHSGMMLLMLLSGMAHAASDSIESPAGTREAQLSEMSQDHSLPLNQRVAATIMLGNYSGTNALIAVGRASRSQHTELRIASIDAAQRWQGRAKWDVVSPLLDDTEHRVQSRAVRALAPLWSKLPDSYRRALDPAIDRQIAASEDTSDGRLEKAWLYRMRQQYQESEQLLLSEWQSFEQPRVAVALAELYRDTNRQPLVLDVLEQGVAAHSDSALLHHSLALTYWRAQQSRQSIDHMRQAYKIEPRNAHYAYLLGLMLLEAEPKQAITLFETAYVQQGTPQYLYSLCEAKLVVAEAATNCLSQLSKYYPESAITSLTRKYSNIRNIN